VTKKRRLPAGKLPEGSRARGRSVENELLSRLLGQGNAALDWLRKRRPELTQEQAEAMLRRCQAAKEEGFALVAAALQTGGGSIQAMGQCAKAHPWIDVENLEALNRLGWLYAK